MRKKGKFFDGNWGFGQNGQERKWAFELNIVVDVIGQYILNANGGRQNEKELGDEERRQESRRIVAGTTCTKNVRFWADYCCGYIG